MGYINSFILTDDPGVIARGKECGVTEFTVASSFPGRFEGIDGVTVYKTVRKSSDCDYPRLFLPVLTDDNLTDAVAEAVLSGMAQCGAKLILCPTSSMGYGYGIPHYPAYIRKLDVSLGSGDNRFNRGGDMLTEARALVLGCNSEMRDENAVDLKKLFRCFSDKIPSDPAKLLFG